MNKELKPCWCGELPDLMHYTENGKAHISYMCDQTIDEHLPHALMGGDAESEEEARRVWNRMMDAIESHYQRKYGMKTCADCRYWNDFDGVCWNSSTPNFCHIRNGDYSCKDFEPEQEDENEDDA